MSEKLPSPGAFDHLVFDSEPFVAYFDDESNADVVDSYLIEVQERGAAGYMSEITRTEVLYVCTRSKDFETAMGYVQTLEENGIRVVDTSATWARAARIKVDHTIALGDAFTVATGQILQEDDSNGQVGVVVGADDDFDPFVETCHGEGDDVDSPNVFRFRNEAD